MWTSSTTEKLSISTRLLKLFQNRSTERYFNCKLILFACEKEGNTYDHGRFFLDISVKSPQLRQLALKLCMPRQRSLQAYAPFDYDIYGHYQSSFFAVVVIDVL